MFIKSRCTNTVINSDKIIFMSVEKNPDYYGNEDTQYKFCLIAYVDDGTDEGFWLGTADDMETLVRLEREITNEINLTHVVVRCGQVDIYRKD